MKWLVSTAVLLALGAGAVLSQAKEEPADIRWWTDVHEASVQPMVRVKVLTTNR